MLRDIALTAISAFWSSQRNTLRLRNTLEYGHKAGTLLKNHFQSAIGAHSIRDNVPAQDVRLINVSKTNRGCVAHVSLTMHGRDRLGLTYIPPHSRLPGHAITDDCQVTFAKHKVSQFKFLLLAPQLSGALWLQLLLCNGRNLTLLGSSLYQSAPLPDMQTLMVRKATTPLVSPATIRKRAHERLFACMYPHVCMQITLSTKRFCTFGDLAEKPCRLSRLFARSFLRPRGRLPFDARSNGRGMHTRCNCVHDRTSRGGGGGRAAEVDTGEHHEIVLKTG